MGLSRYRCTGTRERARREGYYDAGKSLPVAEAEPGRLLDREGLGVTDTARERRAMVESQLEARGIHDPRVLEAMASVPRELFLPADRRPWAYRDRAVPIDHGQTVSQPYMVAAMTEALELSRDDVVLEVGTGSGYQTAVLSRTAGQVYTIERLPDLLADAEHLLAELGCRNVHFRAGDGSLGWPEHAPYHAIVVTAGSPSAPPALKEQLEPAGGRLVIPVGARGRQNLTRYTRSGNEYVSERLMGCSFVPLIGEEGWPGDWALDPDRP